MKKIVLIFSVLMPANVIAAQPETSVLMEKANALFLRGRISRSIEFYQEIIKSDAGFMPAYLNSAMAYRALGENQKAIAVLRKVTAVNPVDLAVRTELGWLYCHEGNLPDAEREFSEAIRVKEDYPDALFGLGVVRLKSGQFQDAVELFQKVKRIRPNFAAVDFMIGLAFERNGSEQKSLESYLSALKRDWTFAEARIDLARIYAKLDKAELAYKQYAKIIDLDPDSSDAKDSVKKFSGTLKEIPDSASLLESVTFTQVKPLALNFNERKIKVGIWTSPAGLAPKLASFKFAVSGDFKVIGLKSGKIYAEAKGGSGKMWKAYVSGRNLSDLESPTGTKLGPFAYGIRIQPATSGQTVRVWDAKKIQSISSDWWTAREVRGSIEIFPGRAGGIYLLNEIGVEDYLLGVVAKEVPSDWPPATLKAQAIIARNQAILRKDFFHPHRRYAYHLCDGQHCQVYGGVGAETETTAKAVQESAGKFLYFGKSLAYSYYHSSCGGTLRSTQETPGWGQARYLAGRADSLSENLFPKPAPWDLNRWIKSDPPSNCNLGTLVSSSEFRWLRVVPAEIIFRKMNRKRRIGKIQAIVPLNRGKSGHVTEVLVSGKRGKIILKKENEIRSALGLESLRSSLFLIEHVRNSAGQVVEFWIYGGGWGHGVGLCQSGSCGLAKKEGKSAEEILQFYFPGTQVR